MHSRPSPRGSICGRTTPVFVALRGGWAIDAEAVSRNGVARDHRCQTRIRRLWSGYGKRCPAHKKRDRRMTLADVDGAGAAVFVTAWRMFRVVDRMCRVAVRGQVRNVLHDLSCARHQHEHNQEGQESAQVGHSAHRRLGVVARRRKRFGRLTIDSPEEHGVLRLPFWPGRTTSRLTDVQTLSRMLIPRWASPSHASTRRVRAEPR